MYVSLSQDHFEKLDSLLYVNNYIHSFETWRPIMVIILFLYHSFNLSIIQRQRKLKPNTQK